jgi:hypothetical protein
LRRVDLLRQPRNESGGLENQETAFGRSQTAVSHLQLLLGRLKIKEHGSVTGAVQGVLAVERGGHHLAGGEEESDEPDGNNGKDDKDGKTKDAAAALLALPLRLFELLQEIYGVAHIKDSRQKIPRSKKLKASRLKD